MRVKFIKEEDFVNYKKPCMFIGTCFCDFKCCHEAGFPTSLCQNEPWSKEPIKEFKNELIIDKFLKNPFTDAIVIGGMEPFLQFDEVYEFIGELRSKTTAPVAVYTGYYKSEIEERVEKLSQFENIIIKFGRYKPNQEKHFDPVLGVYLASDNQYAEKIS